MPPVLTAPSSTYSNLLRSSIPGGAFFRCALYPPVLQNQFNVGMVFSCTGNGMVNTLGSIPPHEMAQYIASGPQALVPLLSQNVETRNSLPIFNGNNVDLTGLGIHSGPFVVSPQDRVLNCYNVSPFREAALLVPGSQCHRRTLLDTFPFDDSASWQTLKSTLFADGTYEIYLVTEIYTTDRWALDYRPSTIALPSTYVVNAQLGFHGMEIAPNFRLHHNSLSPYLRESPPNNSEQYTILANYRPVQRRELGGEGGWIQPFKAAFRRVAKRFSIHRQRPVQTPMCFPMSTFSTMNSETIVEHLSRLHLGGTLYLLEITQDGLSPRYVLESEGHQEGFSLDNYFRYLGSLATQYGLSDWRGALAVAFPPAQPLESPQIGLGTTGNPMVPSCPTFPSSDGFPCDMDADYKKQYSQCDSFGGYYRDIISRGTNHY